MTYSPVASKPAGLKMVSLMWLEAGLHSFVPIFKLILVILYVQKSDIQQTESAEIAYK